MPALLFTIVCIVASCVLFYFIEKLLIKYNFNVPNEVLGIYFNVVGVLYTLILAFVVVAVWQDYVEISAALETEAHELMDIREEATDLPHPFDEQIEEAVVTYAQSVVDDEWKMMDAGQVSSLAEENMAELVVLRKQLAHDTTGAEVVTEIRERIAAARELRHQRLLHTHAQLPTLLWIVLIAGSAVCVVLSFLLHVKNIVWQTLLTAVMTSVLGMVLYLVFSLTNPFSGGAMLSPHSFEEVIKGGHVH